MAFPAHSLSPSEHAALLAAERDGVPFLAYRDGHGDLRLMPLPAAGRVRIGRTPDNDVTLDSDPEVSRAHAHVDAVGGGWTLVDDGISRNGTFVNGERITRHRRLADRDMLLIGQTSLLFRAPVASGAASTVAASGRVVARLTAAERRVLVALCVPLLAPGGSAAPASNSEIAAALHLSMPGVKSHIRALFRKLEVDHLPPNRKRAELARRALQSGLVTAHDQP